jgi:Zn-dependent protease
MLDLTVVQKIAVWFLPVLFAITLHEAAHAAVANYFGDTTAKAQGRLTLNPLAHIELFGTIILPLMILILSQFQFVFGWAKPVPLNTGLLRKPRSQSAYVALAGPLSNFIMALLWALVLKIVIVLSPTPNSIVVFVILTAQAGIFINLVFGVLNCIPIPPLDGSRVLSSLLPLKQAYLLSKVEPYGFLILILLMFSGILNLLLVPPINAALTLIKTLISP